MDISNVKTDNDLMNVIAKALERVDRQRMPHVEPEHTLGVLLEEFTEFTEAVHNGSDSNKLCELIDIIVTCLRGSRLYYNGVAGRSGKVVDTVICGSFGQEPVEVPVSELSVTVERMAMGSMVKEGRGEQWL